MGGDEFAVLLPEVGIEGARVVAERPRARIAGCRVDADVGSVALTVSIGIAACDLRKGSPDTCLQAADDALLAAKRTDRNLVRAG